MDHRDPRRALPPAVAERLAAQRNSDPDCNRIATRPRSVLPAVLWAVAAAAVTGFLLGRS